MPRKLRMPHGGARTGGGRRLGSQNKATIERAKKAELELAEARASNRKLAKDVLEEFMHLFAGMASVAQPMPPGQVNIDPRRKPHEPTFEKYARLTVATAAQLAAYQSPTFKAIAVIAPSPEILQQKMLPDNVVTLRDPVGMSRVYQNMVKASRVG